MSTTTTTTTILRAEGFSCPSCVAKIEKRVGKLAGVERVKVHFASARIEVDHDPAVASVDDLVGAVAKAGYTARPPPSDRRGGHQRPSAGGLVRSLTCSVVVGGLGPARRLGEDER